MQSTLPYKDLSTFLWDTRYKQQNRSEKAQERSTIKGQRKGSWIGDNLVCMDWMRWWAV